MKNNGLLRKLKTEYIGGAYSLICGILIIVLTLAVIVFIASQGMRTFTVDKYSIIKFLTSTNWAPGASKPQFGALIFIIGSTLVSIGAVILSTPVSIAIAIFINFISPKMGEKVFKPALELFVGIPSVVYGWTGFVVLLPFIKKSFGGIGLSLLAAIIVLSIMILPTIASISTDSIKVIPKEYMEASYGLGATRWQTIYKVILPAAKGGILTGIILGLARAFGEALAVQMLIGNSIKLPKSLIDTTSTITSVITMDMGGTVDNSPWNDALWSLALLLLVMSFAFIIIIKLISARGEKR